MTTDLPKQSTVLEKVLRDRDFWSGLAFIGVGLVLLLGTTELRPGPRALPSLLGWVIGACGVVLLGQTSFRIARSSGKTAESRVRDPAAPRGLVTVFAILGLVVSYSLAEVLGFYTAFGLYLWGLHMYLAQTRTLRGVGKALLFTVSVLAVMYVLFRVLLFVRTPSGLLI